jgi:hypothetical protein
MNSLYIVNGRISLWGSAIIRRFREHGWQIQYTEESPEKCTATVTKNGESITETFLFSEAEASGYVKDRSGSLKIGWIPGMNRKLKMRYGVLATIAKTYLPEIMGSATGVAEIDQDAYAEPVDNKEKIKQELESRAKNLPEDFEPKVIA